MDYKKKIKELEKEIKEKDKRIEELEKISDAFNRITEVFNEELKEADKTLKAYETLQEIILKEKIDNDKTVQAYEIVEELSNREKQEIEKFLKAQEAVNKLSFEELLHKENVLRKILEVNRNLSSILNTDILLHKILRYIIESVRAQRGIIFLKSENKLIPAIYLNFKKEDLNKNYFTYPQSQIYECVKTKESIFVVNHPIVDREEKISFMCIPLTYREKLLGVVYVDIISSTDTFSESDFSIGEIFCLQASVSLYNSILYSEIRRQNKELIKLINIKNEFINKMSEQLKAPLNHILDELRSLYKGGNLPVELRNKILSALILKVEKITNTVNKVINFVSLESSAEELFKDKIHIEELIDSILENYREEILNKNLNISVNIESECKTINGNKAIFKTILDELISNAIFYNKQGGMVTIKSSHTGEKYKFEVIDTGEGIKKEELSRIFEQFYRGQYAPALNQKGAGLGLYMVKSLVQSYGGTITVNSVEGEGSKFTVLIPAY
jgi:signal transduction histidine kinase